MRKAKTFPLLSLFLSFKLPLKPVITGIFFFILWMHFPSKVQSQQVYLDYTYGHLGFAEYSFANQGPSEVKVKVQSDGKIIQAGSVFVSSWMDFIVSRLNSNGSIDSTFGNSGKLILSIATGHDYLKDIAIQPDGKILLAGDSHDIGMERSFTVVRVNPDGTLDNSFGNNGVVRTFVVNSVNVDNYLFAIALQADNKILAGGRTLSSTNLAMVRYNANGALDSSFGTNGKVLTQITSNDPHFNGTATLDDIVVQPDNTILIAGLAEFDSIRVVGSEIFRIGLYNILLARYTSNGSLDGSFGENGIVLTPMAQFGLFASGHAHTIALVSDNKILVQGEIFNNTTEKMQSGLIRYNTDGSVDNTYGVNGLATASFGTAQNFHDLLIESDEKCLVIGATLNGTELGFTILRFNEDGTQDASFNSGYLYFPGPTGRCYAYSGAFQNDKVIVAGYSQPDIGSSNTLRFLSIRIRLTGINCSEITPALAVNIPDASALPQGVQLNTVYPAYSPASSITLTANASGGAGSYTYLWSNNSTSQSITVNPLVETTYSVTVLDGIGCLQTASKTISVINVDCGNGKVAICHLTNDPNHPIEVCVGQSSVASHLAQGCYLGDCSSGAAAQSNPMQADQAHSFDLKLYPNPSRYAFSIIAQTDNSVDKIEMRIIDVAGRTVEINRNVKPNQAFSIGQNLSPGIYFVEMRQGDNQVLKKLLKF